MTSTDLLEDYNVLRDIIFDGIKGINDDLDLNNLKDANIKVYLNNLKDEIGSDASTSTAYIYIDSILNEIDKINIYDVEDDDSKTELEIKKQTIIQKKKSLKIYQMSLIVLFGGLGLFIFVKTITNYRNSDKRSKTNILRNNSNNNTKLSALRELNENKVALTFSTIDNICYSLVLFYIAYLVYFNFNYNIELVNVEYKKYSDIKNNEIRKINSSLRTLKNIINKLICGIDPDDADSNSFINNFSNSINPISENILGFNENYNLLTASSIDNKLSKEDKIKDINILFDNFKDTIYKQNNKFDNIIVNNEKNVVCLMNILLYLDGTGNNEPIICNLNNSEGLKGLIEKQKNAIDPDQDNVFMNGFEDIADNDANLLYDKITSNIIDESNKFELMDMKLFTAIVNIFKNKIYKYDIKKHDFILYIYTHFENMDLEKNNITISKFDIINNYKTIINIIYDEYDTYKKIKLTNKKFPIYQVSLNKFNEIVKKIPVIEIKETNKLLLETIDKIEDFKNIYGTEIYNDIKKEQRFNKSLEYLIYLTILITFLQVTKIMFSSEFKDNFIEDAINVVKYISLALLFNAIIFSYWNKRNTDTNYSEMIIRNNDNIFITELHELNRQVKNVEIIKNLDSSSNDVYKLLNNKKILESTNGNGDKIYTLDIGEDKVILENDDIKNMIYEDYYVQLTKVMDIYECCSFLTRKKKIPVFPWTDFTINLIFYIIVFLIMFNIFLINDDLNPFTIITNLKSRLIVNKTDISKLKDIVDKNKISLSYNNSSSQTGGDTYRNEIFKQKNLINLLVIYLSMLYTYKIYESTYRYDENLFK
tara:strand:- start:8707 stop:11169 length:2463 start_codon:yes stop_codon:yes gene_type:complete